MLAWDLGRTTSTPCCPLSTTSRHSFVASRSNGREALHACRLDQSRRVHSNRLSERVRHAYKTRIEHCILIAGNAATQKSYLDSMFSSERGPWAGQSPSAQAAQQSSFSCVNTGAGNESVFKPLMVDAGSQPTSFTGQGFLDMIRASTSSQAGTSGSMSQP